MTLIHLIGAAVFFYYLLQALIGVTNLFRLVLWQNTDVKKDFKKTYGEWAVVTGATDGIGKAFAKRFASRGMNIVLVSRTQSKLDNVAKEIETEFGVKAATIQADFSHGFEVSGKIKAGLQDKDIGVLFNNVGEAISGPEAFMEMSDEDVQKVITINIISMLIMTSIILPKMLKNNRGLILNNSSASAFFPVPLLSAYSSSKAWVSSFSRALKASVKENVEVKCIVPAFVMTNMTIKTDCSIFKRKPGILIPSSEVYARASFNALERADVTTGFGVHDVAKVMICLPDFVRSYFLYGFFYLWILDQKRQRRLETNLR